MNSEEEKILNREGDITPPTYSIGNLVKAKLTGEQGMIVGKIINSETVYLVRLSNYAEIAFRHFELELEV